MRIEPDEEIELSVKAIEGVEDSFKEDVNAPTTIPKEKEKITTKELESTKVENRRTISEATDKNLEARKLSNATLDPTGNKENSSNQNSNGLKNSLNSVPLKASQGKEKLIGRPKFDLKASLSRPLSYKPYTGKLPPMNR